MHLPTPYRVISEVNQIASIRWELRNNACMYGVRYYICIISYLRISFGERKKTPPPKKTNDSYLCTPYLMYYDMYSNLLCTLYSNSQHNPFSSA